MKKLIIILSAVVFQAGLIIAQESEEHCIPRIGEPAPAFTASSTQGEIHFPDDYRGKWVILFSHPGDFTPVCTSEFMDIATHSDMFEKLNTELLALSTDGLNSHYEWIKTMRDEIEFNGMKDVEINFPIISDFNMDVSKKYGMIHPQSNSTKDVRAVFFIDPSGFVRAINYYPISNGRSTKEMIRILAAMQTTDKYDVATPSEWQPGEDVFIPPPYTSKKNEKQYVEAWENYDCPSWFMCLKKIPMEDIIPPEK